jgi:hypothetical protein
VTAAALALALAALPAGADRRYRVELAGEHVGAAALAVTCGPASCRLAWRSELRAPREAGGAAISRTIDAELEPGCAARSVRAVVESEL